MRACGCRKQTSVSARHNDPQAFADAIAMWRTAGGIGHAWIAVESLYSMDGDRAPLDASDRHCRSRMTPCWSSMKPTRPASSATDGRGLGAHLEGRANVISLHTCGKALGVMGALVLAPRSMRDFLVNRARPFIYATAPSPLMAATVRAALGHRAARTGAAANNCMSGLHLPGSELSNQTTFAPSGSQIQPIIVGSDGVSRCTRRCVEGQELRYSRHPPADRA